MGNDSFLDKGQAHRVIIDYEGYFRISKTIKLIYSDNKIKSAFLSVLLRERPLLHSALYVKKYATLEEWHKAKNLFIGLGASSAVIGLIGILPSSLLKFISTNFTQRIARRVLR
jgi:abequosyltransferase